MTNICDDKNLEEALKKKQEEELKKAEEDDDQNFIKKDDPNTQRSEAEAEIQAVIDGLKKIKNLIKPITNQQRNLDKEIGGLEAEEQKESSEKDVWDDRSEEVDKMGSTDTFNTTGMKSVVDKQKKNRLRAKKLHEQGADAAAAMASKGKSEKSAPEGLGLGMQKQSFTQRIQQLKQDRSHENGGGGMGI